MNKSDRQKIYDKYGGRCAYCGCQLQKGWHVDEIEPVHRYKEYIKDDFGNRIYNFEKREYETKNSVQFPERFHIDNQNPACPSCNINKHSEPLETFRTNIKAYMKHLNEISTQYKIAKRYGLVIETDKPVLFYFETLAIKPNLTP